MTVPMNCAEAAGQLSDLLEDSLSEAVRQGVADHVRGCPSCARRLRELTCARRLLRRLPREPMPDTLKTQLIDTLRPRPHDPPPRTLQHNPTDPAPAHGRSTDPLPSSALEDR